METEFHLNLDGVSCGSCEKLIEMVALQNNARVRNIDAASGSVTFVCEENAISKLKQKLAEKGFTEKKADSQSRGDWSGPKKYIGSILAGENETKVESTLFQYSLGSLVVLGLLSLIVYTIWFQALAKEALVNALAYMPLAILSIIVSIAITFSYHHMMGYKKSMACTTGMMVGMTIGMLAGFMTGALIGATNGMFIGSLAGMTFGIVLGVGLGRCCGVMGAMEGIMAGLMSGVMGAMTSIMMLNDNVVPFLYISFAISIFTMGGLSYMMYREIGPLRKGGSGMASNAEPVVSFGMFIACSLISAAILILLMFFGPKGPIVYP